MITQRTHMTGRLNVKDQEGSIKKDNTNFDSAKDMQKLDGKDIGQVLNEISDPNYVDPKKLRKVGNNQLDKDAFLKLMLEQMKHQDPTNPLQSHEMAAQLAQFTSLEQLQNMNTNIGKLVESQQPHEKFQALSMIGKSINSDTSYIAHAEGMKDHDIRFDLANEAKDVEVIVRDAEGKDVRKYEFHNLKKGTNSVSWNARTDDGSEVRPGDFRVFITAKDESGKSVNAKTDISGKITGVNFTAAGPVLMVGNQSVKLSDVKQIVDPSVVQDQSKKSEDITNMDLRKLEPKEENKGVQQKGNLDKVVMSKELSNTLKEKDKDGKY
jgi:flagellar basal-body rod modification protein FlgD